MATFWMVGLAESPDKADPRFSQQDKAEAAALNKTLGESDGVYAVWEFPNGLAGHSEVVALAFDEKLWTPK